MYSFAVEDVNQALQFGIEHLLHEGVTEDSRNGPVLVAPGPVCIEYLNPRARVLFSATRDANPVFHLMESIWMLSGSNECAFPRYFNGTYSQFSDDGGKTMWDAYGARWKNFFGYDQLEVIIKELKEHPESRRCVLAMWNAMPECPTAWAKQVADGVLQTYPLDSSDLYIATHGGNAVPCNVVAFVAMRKGKLDLTVCNRSNDLIWGMCGANSVHFPFLQEYMAMRIGVPLGSFYQFTNNMHSYTSKFSREKLEQIAYECNTLGRTPELGPALEPGFDEDLKIFMEWANAAIAAGAVPVTRPALGTAFMHSVALPMFMAWAFRKRGDITGAGVCLDNIGAPDWQRACQEWNERRVKK
jgi:hypothetical protein